MVQYGELLLSFSVLPRKNLDLYLNALVTVAQKYVTLSGICSKQMLWTAVGEHSEIFKDYFMIKMPQNVLMRSKFIQHIYESVYMFSPCVITGIYKINKHRK